MKHSFVVLSLLVAALSAIEVHAQQDQVTSNQADVNINGPSIVYPGDPGVFSATANGSLHNNTDRVLRVYVTLEVANYTVEDEYWIQPNANHPIDISSGNVQVASDGSGSTGTLHVYCKVSTVSWGGTIIAASHKPYKNEKEKKEPKDPSED